MRLLILFLLLLLGLQSAYAAQYYRCTNASGNTLFSQEPCGPDAVIETVDESYIGGENRGDSPNAIDQLKSYRQKIKHIDEITGAKSKVNRKSRSSAEPCDSVSTLELRNARVSKDVMKCHTTDDVKHIYGEPASISTWSERSGYDTRWKYRTEQDGKMYIFFKEGLVMKWSNHN
jgi:hypothetical protein